MRHFCVFSLYTASVRKQEEWLVLCGTACKRYKGEPGSTSWQLDCSVHACKECTASFHHSQHCVLLHLNIYIWYKKIKSVFIALEGKKPLVFALVTCKAPQIQPSHAPLGHKYSICSPVSLFFCCYDKKDQWSSRLPHSLPICIYIVQEYTVTLFP